MQFVKMTESDRKDVMEMSAEFYRSDAVSHDADEEKLKDVFETAISEFQTFDGFIIKDENGSSVGYSYISQYYESEIGGMCVMIIDLFIRDEYRGKGIATSFFEFIKREYKNAKRFRLEVMPDNIAAINTYRKWGFKDLIYKQMIIDVD